MRLLLRTLERPFLDAIRPINLYDFSADSDFSCRSNWSAHQVSHQQRKPDNQRNKRTDWSVQPSPQGQIQQEYLWSKWNFLQVCRDNKCLGLHAWIYFAYTLVSLFLLNLKPSCAYEHFTQWSDERRLLLHDAVSSLTWPCGWCNVHVCAWKRLDGCCH